VLLLGQKSKLKRIYNIRICFINIEEDDILQNGSTLWKALFVND